VCVCVCVQVILVFSVIQFKPARYEDYVYPPWAQAVGWIIALASIIWIPLAAAHTLWVLPGSFAQVLDTHSLRSTFQKLNGWRSIYFYVWGWKDFLKFFQKTSLLLTKAAFI